MALWGVTDIFQVFSIISAPSILSRRFGKQIYLNAIFIGRDGFATAPMIRTQARPRGRRVWRFSSSCRPVSGN
jgi:hypothetical protein